MNQRKTSNTILILDFGDPRISKIADCINNINLSGKIVPHNISIKEIQTIDPKGIVLSGGPSSVYAEGSPLPSPEIFTLDIPILGICYGMQAIAHCLGGTVVKAKQPEQGETKIVIREHHTLFENMATDFIAWMNHDDEVAVLPPEFSCIAHTVPENKSVMAHATRKIWGVQFHPETVPQHGGLQLLQNFCHTLCD